jgi:hypothetical protein
MADGCAVYSNVSTRHVKILELQKEHSILGCPLQAHTRGKLGCYRRRTTHCLPAAGGNEARTRDGKLDQGRSRSALTPQT